MTEKVKNINTAVLKECREQIGLALTDVAKKIPRIELIETGDKEPTFKQLNTLADLYRVPRWVFISERLPEQYKFSTAVQAFRKLSDSNDEIFSNSRVRLLTAQVERFRSLLLELREDMYEPIAQFSPPPVDSTLSVVAVGNLFREWLGVGNENIDFPKWKTIIEKKGVFVFLTSRYKGWSHIDLSLFRGLTIYHSTLPIIVINDSDTRKARTFTLIHELVHIIRKESNVDDWGKIDCETEKWCDEIAGNVLIPAAMLSAVAEKVNDLDSLKKLAKKFKVSAYACLVRLRQLNFIDQPMYKNLEARLLDEYARIREKLKENDGGLARNRSKEVLEQYGNIYTRTLLQAYHNQELSLHRVTHLFGLKRSSEVFEMESQL